MDQCYNDLGSPVVTFDSFWEVYCALHDKVDAAIPLEVVTSLDQTNPGEPEEQEAVTFALAHLKAPELDMGGNSVDSDVGGDGDEDEELTSVSFTNENDQDQLY